MNMAIKYVFKVQIDAVESIAYLFVTLHMLIFY